MSKQKTTRSGNEEDHDVSSLSLVELVSMLKPAQVWTVITVLFAILGGSFGLGYKLRGLTSEAAGPNY